MHLAQVNAARLRDDVESPRMASFVRAVDRVNRLAEQAPGFVWRSADSSGAHVAVAADDPRLVMNVSVWASYEHLHAFTYRSAHGAFVRHRADWFEPIETPATALWWVPAGTEPSLAEAGARLAHLRRYGPTPQAFTVRRRFTAAGRAERRTIPGAGLTARTP